MEYRRLLKLVVLSLLPVLDTELILEVAKDPHLTNDVAVEWHVGTLDELDQETRTWKQMGQHRGRQLIRKHIPRAITTEMSTATQKVTVPKRMTTSSTKSMLGNREYIAIHASMTTDEPMTITHVMTVQLMHST